MSSEKLKLHPERPLMTAEDAAEVLKLAKDDPSVSLYAAIELFEAGKNKEALPKFLHAAEHQILYAIPYLEFLQKKLKFDEETKTRFGLIQEWSQYASGCDIGHENHFKRSQCLISLKKLQTSKKKKDQKKFKSELEYFSFRSKGESDKENGHEYYQQALFYFAEKNFDQFKESIIWAAKRGHLIGIAMVIRFKLSNSVAIRVNPFASQICDPNHHNNNQQYSFADRIYLTSHYLIGIGKRDFHTEAVRLGTRHAFGMIADFYFLRKNLHSGAYHLCMMGMQLGDPMSTIYLAQLHRENQLPTVGKKQLSLGLIFDRLCDYLNGNFRVVGPEFFRGRDYKTTIQQNTVNEIINLISTYLDDRAVYNNVQLLTSLEHFVENTELDSEFRELVLKCLQNITTKRANKNTDVDIKLTSILKSIDYLEKLHELTGSDEHLKNLFISKKDLFDFKVENDMLTEDEQTDCLVELHNRITQLEKSPDYEAFLNENFFILSCTKVYEHLTQRPSGFSKEQKDEYDQQYLKYIHLAEKAELPEYKNVVAHYYLEGGFGFKQNPLKAREIIFSLSEEDQKTLENIHLVANSFFLDQEQKSTKGIEYYLSHAKKLPELFNTVADCYLDGRVGLLPDHELAGKYYQQAVDHDFLEGHVGLGILMVDKAKFSDEDEEKIDGYKAEAMKHYQIAYDAGSTDAAFFLGEAYLFGKLVEHDIDKAKHYLQEAVTRGNHAYSQAYLAMIEAGFRGEEMVKLKHQALKLSILKETGFIYQSTDSLFEYGYFHLTEDSKEGCQYINTAALNNNTCALYVLASFQMLLKLNLFKFEDDIIDIIQEQDYMHLFDQEPPWNLNPVIKNFFLITNVVREYQEKGHPLPSNYAHYLFSRIFTSFVTIDEIVAEIREKFPTEEVAKVRSLMARMQREEKSADATCEEYTQELLASKKSHKQQLAKKFQSHLESDKLSMNNLGTCLNAFLKTGIKVKGDDKKSIQALRKMHRPHGRGDKNTNQELEGGREKTGKKALGAMLEALKK